MKIMSANRIAPDGTLCFAASHLGLFCLPMTNKKDAMLILVNCDKSLTDYESFIVNHCYLSFQFKIQ